MSYDIGHLLAKYSGLARREESARQAVHIAQQNYSAAMANRSDAGRQIEGLVLRLFTLYRSQDDKDPLLPAHARLSVYGELKLEIIIESPGRRTREYDLRELYAGFTLNSLQVEIKGWFDRNARKHQFYRATIRAKDREAIEVTRARRLKLKSEKKAKLLK